MPTYRSRILLTSVISLAFFGLAKAEIPLGNANLLLTGAASVAYNDNIYLRSKNPTGDTMLTLTPGMELTGQGADKWALGYQANLLRYRQQTSQNTELDHAYGQLAINTGKTAVTSSASYQVLAQNSQDFRLVNGFVRRQVSMADLTCLSNLTGLFKAAGSLTWDHVNLRTRGFANTEDFGSRLEGRWAASPKLDLTAGYRYKDFWVAGPRNNYSSHFFSLGATGEISPKLSGTAKAGYILRKPQQGREEGALGLENNLALQWTAKIQSNLTLAHDFSSASTGDSQRRLNATLSHSFTLSAFQTVNIHTGYDYLRYGSGRRDRMGTASLGFTQKFTDQFQGTASYAYQGDKSTLAGGGFASQTVTVSASIRW